MDPVQLSEILNMSLNQTNFLFALSGLSCGYLTAQVILSVVWG